MDVKGLRSGLVDSSHFLGYTSIDKKLCAEDFIQSILDAIRAEDRSPDDWEALDLGAAIGFLSCRWYHAAIASANRALSPIEHRSPVQLHRVDAPPTNEQLQRALDYYRSMPA
jgi:hypothetical protein